jgi:hypothetical protein
LSVSETTIRRRIRNPKISTYQTIETIAHGYKKIHINGNIFPSVKSVVLAGLAKDRFQVWRRVNSKNKKWQH